MTNLYPTTHYLYHVTSRKTFEKYILKEGLIPVCNEELKNFQSCPIGIYFFISYDEALDFGTQLYIQQNPQKWYILGIELQDIINSCNSISKDEGYGYEVEYSSAIIAYPNKEFSSSFDYPCLITLDKIKIIKEFL